MERLGEILVRRGACTRASVSTALQQQAVLGGRLGTNLLELGAVTEEALAFGLEAQLGVPALFGSLVAQEAALRLLPPELADRWDVVPYLSAERRLALLVLDPRNLRMLDEVAFATGRSVHPFVVPEARLWRVLRKAYQVIRDDRGVASDTRLVARGVALGGEAPPATATDLMDQAGFDSLYAVDTPPPVPGGDPIRTPPPLATDDPEAPPFVEASLLEEDEAAPPPLTLEVLEALSREPGHAPPAALAPLIRPVVEGPEPSPLLFGEALRFLEGVEERGAIARTVLRYARTRFQRALLLSIHRGAASGWAGLGGHLGPESVRRIRIPLDGPGVVETVVRTRAHYLGPLQKTDANVRLLASLGGGVPRNAFLVPILALGGRVVNVLYADAGRGGTVDPAGMGELIILATRIAQSFDALARRAV